jgi:alkylation response protein AidB-like acyl-CoA dehydrogenase
MFIQSPPSLGNQYHADSLLRGYLERTLPDDVLPDVRPQLERIGALAGGELYQLQLEDRLNEPRLVQWDAWGNRVDRIELTELWRKAAVIAAREGLVAMPYEPNHGRYARIGQFAALYLFHPSSDFYTCPLAMSDGAARTLLKSGNRALIERAVPKLTSRDPNEVWTSGQWMTEATGGSDVGSSLTSAVRGADGVWKLTGKKWFTSAINSQMALTLARPQGNGPGGRNLALFYVETRAPNGALNNIRVERLKDKLGTRKVPTAELCLDGAVAQLVGEPCNGTRAIEPMLVITRAWNSISAAACMRRALALTQSYASERLAFGKRLRDLPLHARTLAWMEAETHAVVLLAFELIALIGRDEANEISESQCALLRLLTPLVKLSTAKQAVAVVSEAVEAFGGAGYVEDTGIPLLLRDTQVLPIWEGTTNVLALDAVLRSDLAAGTEALCERIRECGRFVKSKPLSDHITAALENVKRVADWLVSGPSAESLQAEARTVAMTLARALERALLVEHASWLLEIKSDSSGAAMLENFNRFT